MRIVMMGTGTFAEPTFEALLSNFAGDVVGLVTQPERDAGNKRGSTRQTGKGMAQIARGLPRVSEPAVNGGRIEIVQPESINTPEGVAALRELRPDLMVVAAYGQILSKEVLSVPAVGTINVHASLLPKYRGAAPVAYAILNGETQTGVTIIKVTPGLDSGDMILQESLDIRPDDTTGTLEARLAVLGAKLAAKAVRIYQGGCPIQGEKQDPALVTKAPKIKKEFGLIDWTKPAEYIERFVRAMQPWPTAYTFLHRLGKASLRVILTDAHPAMGPRLEGAIPGTPFVFDAERDCIYVKTGGRELVCIDGLQPAGKKPLSAVEFLRGHSITDGMRFGPEVLS